MSLSSLNSPPLIAGLGAGLHVALPYLESLNISYPTLRMINLVSFGMNFVSTSIPGRIDGQEAKDLSSKGKSGAEPATMKDLSPTTGKTLVAPSGWAFAIWGPIFAGEMVLVTSQFFVSESSSPALASLIQKASIPFSVAQLFQCLWCASFRPKYKGKKMFISTAMLSSIAYCLSKAHSVYTISSSDSSSSSYPYTLLDYSLHFLPITLHFGWTTAASLVKLSGAVAKQDPKTISTPKVMAGLGHASAVAATVFGVYVTVTQNAPVFGGVIAWALTAVGDGMKKRLEKTGGWGSKITGPSSLFGAAPQKNICFAGALICAGTSVAVALGNKERQL